MWRGKDAGTRYSIRWKEDGSRAGKVSRPAAAFFAEAGRALSAGAFPGFGKHPHRSHNFSPELSTPRFLLHKLFTGYPQSYHFGLKI